jgi:starch synthase
MSKPLKIVHIASEIAPFSKSGGLGDVARSLPKAQARLGHSVITITPLYGQLINPKKYKLELIESNVDIYINSVDTINVNYWRGWLMDGLPVYFIENKKYFSQRKALYGSTHENVRFLVFDVAALKLLSILKFKADIVHCHDWHTGMIPFYLKTDFRYSKTLKKAKTIFTIHNLVFQFGRNWWEVPLEKKDYGRKRIPHITDPDIENINFAKRAILTAEAINTVSEQYREEIMTHKFGQDLNRILKNREDRLFGIVNGIDYNAYNPKNDPGLFKRFSSASLQLRKENKLFVQKKFGLLANAKTPIFCTTSRVTFQKGFELILSMLEPLLRMDVQFIVIGAGDKNYIKELKKFEKKYPHKIAVVPSHEMNQKYETLVLAGSDFFLLPSHHEPCGINQLIAMRYGCIPIVRKIGGLNDTVENYNPARGTGNGFSFGHFDSYSLFGAVIRALETYKNEAVWKKLVARALEQSNSWEIPAKKYISLYRKTMRM